MTRRRRRHFDNPTSKRPTKWCRQFFTDLVQDETNLLTSDVLSLCPITSAIDSQADIVSDVIKIRGTIFRITNADENLRVMWIVAMQKFDVATGVMLQVVNPFDELDLSSQDILGFGFLPVPPVILQADNNPVPSRGSEVFEIDVKAKRKLKRNTHAMVLTFASQGSSGGDGIVQVVLTTSMLMKWGT